MNNLNNVISLDIFELKRFLKNFHKKNYNEFNTIVNPTLQIEYK
jgi:hypothetical protein